MRMNRSICASALHRLVRESGDLAKPLTSHPIFASSHFLSRRSHGCPSTAGVSDSMDRSELVTSVVNKCRNGRLVEADNASFFLERTIRVNPLDFTSLFRPTLGGWGQDEADGFNQLQTDHESIMSMIERMGSKGTTPNSSTRNMLMNYLRQLKRSDLGSSVLCKMVKLGLEPSTASF